MTKIQWFFLWLLFVGYLFMGASVFYVIEHGLENERRKSLYEERNEIHDLLEFCCSKETYVKNLIITKLTEYCGKSFTRVTGENDSVITSALPDEPYHWSFYNAFFFSLTTLSTVGYGNLSPSTDNGRLLMIFYALFGIPFMGIVVSQLGEFFGSVFLRAHSRYKRRVYESCTPLVLDIILYLVPGLLIIIIVPALMFAHFEEWTLITGVYYAFVTLTTIGFGDFVAGQRDERSVLYQVYKVILVIWVMFGLGYLVMVMGFISRGLRNKRLHKLEHKLAHTIKNTRSKIWNEFVQDVTSIRTMLNEMYLLKVKPVYRDKDKLKRGVLGRSNSCPQFASWPVPLGEEEEEDDSIEDESEFDELAAKRRRRRAYSEFVPGSGSLHRVNSESRLDSIDVAATFDRASITTIESKQILARVVDAMSLSNQRRSIDSESLKGVNIFSDEEILASEESLGKISQMSSRWPGRLSNGGLPVPPLGSLRRRRSRAYSFALPYQLAGSPSPHQNTWSGNDPESKVILNNIRNSKGGKSEEILPSQSTEKISTSARGSSSNLRRMSVAAINFLSNNSLTSKLRRKSTKDIETGKIEDTGEREDEEIDEVLGKPRLYTPEVSIYDGMEKAYRTYCGERRPSIIDALAALRPANKSEDITDMGPVMETTSVADLIRLLSSIDEARASRKMTDGKISIPQTSVNQERAGPHPPPSLASLFARRGSAVSTTAVPSNRRRAASISLGLTNSAQPPSLLLQPGGARPRRTVRLQPPLSPVPQSPSISPFDGLSSPPLTLHTRSSSPPPRSGTAAAALLQPMTTSSNRSAVPFPPPTLVVTSPDGTHKFSVQPASSDNDQIAETDDSEYNTKL